MSNVNLNNSNMGWTKTWFDSNKYVGSLINNSLNFQWTLLVFGYSLYMERIKKITLVFFTLLSQIFFYSEDNNMLQILVFTINFLQPTPINLKRCTPACPCDNRLFRSSLLCMLSCGSVLYGLLINNSLISYLACFFQYYNLFNM